MPVNFSEIRSRREKLGLTLQTAAEAAGHKGGRARSWWHDLESGRAPDPRLSTLETICDVLDCSIEDLVHSRQKRRRPSSAPGSNT